MRNNCNPKRRSEARGQVCVIAATMARWSLLRIVLDGMKPIGEYANGTISCYRSAVKIYQCFIGFEQSAVNVSDAKLERFAEWLDVEGYSPKTVRAKVDAIAAVVRFADSALLPNRQAGERKPWSDEHVKGSIEQCLREEYFPINRRIVSKNTVNHYGAAVASLSRFLARPAMLTDLKSELLALWIESMLSQQKRIRTINGYITELRAFSKWAVERGIIEAAPRLELLSSVGDSLERKPKEPKPAPLPSRRPLHRAIEKRSAEAHLQVSNGILRFVDRYAAARDLSVHYVGNLRRRARALAEFGGTAMLDELFTEDMVNDFICSLDRSPFTLRSYRADFISLWNAAADEDLVPYPRLRRIKRAKCPDLAVQ